MSASPAGHRGFLHSCGVETLEGACCSSHSAQQSQTDNKTTPWSWVASGSFHSPEPTDTHWSELQSGLIDQLPRHLSDGCTVFPNLGKPRCWSCFVFHTVPCGVLKTVLTSDLWIGVAGPSVLPTLHPFLTLSYSRGAADHVVQSRQGTGQTLLQCSLCYFRLMYITQNFTVEPGILSKMILRYSLDLG